ncbi:DUF4440 domain-containing protein [Labrenzia sp. CE80]|uniref:DUF4440 domain-containing protein n=1 Tax=Labrenzia sp. CE80 TaxID=1788986 RepID=UPI0018775557|nr:DUF4440 domain-containing protein [Labrenzia sp. CE80]
MSDQIDMDPGAEPHDNGKSEAEEAISQLFEDYLTGFNDFDAERICDCFALPTTIWQHEKGHVFNDEEELLENVEALLSALDKEGVTVSEFHVASSHISGASALVTLDWSQESSSGETALEFTCHYQLLQDGDDWLIAMIINE